MIEKKVGPLLRPRVVLPAQLPPPGKEQIPLAKSEAQRIIESALREADEIRLHAVDEGKEEGRAGQGATSPARPSGSSAGETPRATAEAGRK